jgi:hypothetical protein
MQKPTRKMWQWKSHESLEEDVAADSQVHKLTLPPTATVLMLKQHVERDVGFKSAGVKRYVHDGSREEPLENGEMLRSLCLVSGEPTRAALGQRGLY